VTGATRVPEVPGVLTAAQVERTAAAIAAVQQPDGGIPWAVGGHIDAWNHVEAAMALVVGGRLEAADAAYDWCLRTQRADGSWPMKVVGTNVEDASGDANMTAYLAVGAWHSWLVRRDPRAVRRLWPAVKRGLDWVVGLQRPFGGIAWSVDPAGIVNEEALLAGSSSIYGSLRAGLALAGLVGDPQPEWELAAGRLGHAVAAHPDWFADKSGFSMDWYYPVLGGAVRGAAARALLSRRWDDFVVEGRGCRCVAGNPWVTGAETCELAMALDALADPRATRLLAEVQHTRHESGLYWTGFVHDEGVFWPGEQTTYTSAAVVLAADALSRTTPGNGVFRGDASSGLAPRPAPIGFDCDLAGCAL
jgi:hypothetical protein